ncbi:hypothetical protein ACFXGA_17505 [Actinosynnema sp. NPDC059335]|uniref:hypothetical protein n=1 Tax=Actinosynnema sp. NPDC059335 TaxID=3346804 RepID=UPI0036704B21
MTEGTTGAAIAVWVIALVMLALVAAAAVARRRRAWSRAGTRRQEEREPVPPAPEWRALPPVSLPSALPDRRFTFACTVHWRPHPDAADHAAPGAVAVDAVVQRALRFTVRRHPGDADATQALADLLARREDDPGRHVVAWATDVRLEPAPADLRERRRAWDEEAAAERAVRAHLGRDVPTPGGVVVWWFAHNAGQARDLIGTPARLTAAGDREVDEGLRRRLASGAPLSPFTVGEAADDAPFEPEDHPLSGRDVADLLERYDAPDHAERTRERYGVDDRDDDPPEPADDDDRPS